MISIRNSFSHAFAVRGCASQRPIAERDNCAPNARPDLSRRFWRTDHQSARSLGLVEIGRDGDRREGSALPPEPGQVLEPDLVDTAGELCSFCWLYEVDDALSIAEQVDPRKSARAERTRSARSPPRLRQAVIAMRQSAELYAFPRLTGVCRCSAMTVDARRIVPAPAGTHRSGLDTPRCPHFRASARPRAAPTPMRARRTATTLPPCRQAP